MAKAKTKKTKSPAKSKTNGKGGAAKPKAAAKPAKKEAKKAVAKTAAKSQEAKAKAPAKTLDAKSKAPKKEKTKKPKTGRDEVELDDFEPVDFDGGNEIAEYEDELKAVESEDDDSEDLSLELDTANRDPEEVILTDAEGNRYCRARDCDQIAVVDAYCRYHYLLFWKKIQVRKKILADGKLERYVEELTSRYPDKFLEMIRRDLRTEKDFLAAIQELEIDESGLENEFEEDTQTYIDEVRGMGETASVDEEEF